MSMKRLTVVPYAGEGLSVTVEVTNPEDLIRIAAQISRQELLPVEMDTTGVGLPVKQTLEGHGIRVLRKNQPQGKIVP